MTILKGLTLRASQASRGVMGRQRRVDGEQVAGYQGVHACYIGVTRSLTAASLTGRPRPPGRAHSAPDGRAIAETLPKTARHTHGDGNG